MHTPSGTSAHGLGRHQVMAVHRSCRSLIFAVERAANMIRSPNHPRPWNDLVMPKWRHVWHYENNLFQYARGCSALREMALDVVLADDVPALAHYDWLEANLGADVARQLGSFKPPSIRCSSNSELKAQYSYQSRIRIWKLSSSLASHVSLSVALVVLCLCSA